MIDRLLFGKETFNNNNNNSNNNSIVIIIMIIGEVGFFFFRGVNYFANILWIFFLGLEALLFSSPFPTSMRLRSLEERTNHRQKKICRVLELDFPWSSRHFSDSGRKDFCSALDSVRVWLRNFTRISAYWRYAFLFCLYVCEMLFFFFLQKSPTRES